MKMTLEHQRAINGLRVGGYVEYDIYPDMYITVMVKGHDTDNPNYKTVKRGDVLDGIVVPS